MEGDELKIVLETAVPTRCPVALRDVLHASQQISSAVFLKLFFLGICQGHELECSVRLFWRKMR